MGRWLLKTPSEVKTRHSKNVLQYCPLVNSRVDIEDIDKINNGYNVDTSQSGLGTLQPVTIGSGHKQSSWYQPTIRSA